MKYWITYSLLMALVFALVTSCVPGDKSDHGKKPLDTLYTITGTVRGIDSGRVTIKYYYSDEEFSDTAKVARGTFKFQGTVKYPTIALFSVEALLGSGSKLFFLAGGHTTVEAAADSIENAKISGTSPQDEYTMYTSAMQSFEDRMNDYYAANSEFGNVPHANFQKSMDSLDNVYVRIVAEKLEAIKTYVEAHPESFVAASEIRSNFGYDVSSERLDSVYNFLDVSVKESAIGKDILKMLETSKSTDVGQPAPDFTMNDVKGKPVSLSSMRGRVLLLDFWASWCGPCRMENPNVVEAYKKYHRKGFDVLGVSLDVKREKWLKAIEEDHLDWNHVSDLKGWKSSAGEVYGVNAIPMSFLIDKDGKIVAKNLNGESLVKKLEEIL